VPEQVALPSFYSSYPDPFSSQLVAIIKVVADEQPSFTHSYDTLSSRTSSDT